MSKSNVHHHPARPTRQKTGSFVFGLCESATERLGRLFLVLPIVRVFWFSFSYLTIDRSRKTKGTGRKGVFVVNCRCGFWLLLVWLWRGFIAMAGSFIRRGALRFSALRVVASLLASGLGSLQCHSTI